MGLVAACDIAIAVRSAVFALTEVKLGILPAVISPFVIQKIGEGRARALFLLGNRFDGREAERVGLVHRAVPVDQLDAVVDGIVAELLTSGPRALGSAKALIRAVHGHDLDDAIRITSRWIASLRATPEAREGMAAFLEKRKPQWVR